MPRVKKKKTRLIDPSKLVEILKERPTLKPVRGDTLKEGGNWWRLAVLYYGTNTLSHGQVELLYDSWWRNRSGVRTLFEEYSCFTSHTYDGHADKHDFDVPNQCGDDDGVDAGETRDADGVHAIADAHENGVSYNENSGGGGHGCKATVFHEKYDNPYDAGCYGGDYNTGSGVPHLNSANCGQTCDNSEDFVILDTTVSNKGVDDSCVYNVMPTSPDLSSESEDIQNPYYKTSHEEEEETPTANNAENIDPRQVQLPGSGKDTQSLGMAANHLLRRNIKTPARFKEYVRDAWPWRRKEQGTEFCLCKGPDSGDYLVCDLQTKECLTFYHPSCIGLNNTAGIEALESYSNCPDGHSFVCPICMNILNSCGISVERKTVENDLDELIDIPSIQSMEEMENDLDMKNMMLDTDSHEEISSMPSSAKGEPHGTTDVKDTSTSTVPSHQGTLTDDEETYITMEAAEFQEKRDCMSTSTKGQCVQGTTAVNETSAIPPNERETDDDKDTPATTEEVSLDTLRHLTGCKDLPSGEFFVASVPHHSEFSLTEAEWNYLKPTSSRPTKLHPYWTTMMKKKIMEVCNGFCVLEMKRHRVTRYNSRKKKSMEVVFSAEGQCSFKDCPVRVRLRMKSHQKQPYIVEVTQTGDARHSVTERKANQIAGEERKEILKYFEESAVKPATEYNKRLASRTSDASASGNRTGAGATIYTLRKIATEARSTQHRLDQNVQISLNKLQNELILDERKRNPMGSTVEGYVQNLSAGKDLIIHMWTERQVRLWHDLCQKDSSFLDATGTVVGNWNGKKVLYYALVVKHPKQNMPPLPVAEMLTTVHNVPNLTGFLDSFRYHELKVYGYGNSRSPRQVITDRGRALMLAVIKSFTTEDMPTFLLRAYRIVTGKGTESDYNKMVPHVCCSHMMKDFQLIIKKTAPQSRFTSFFLYICSLLVNSRTLKELTSNYKDIVLLLSSKHLNKDVRKSYNQLSEKLKALGKHVDFKRLDIQDTETTAMDAGQAGIDEEQENSKGPFEAHFQEAHDEVSKRKKEMKFETQKNGCFNPGLLQYIKANISICPYWTGILLGSLERYCSGKTFAKKPLTFKSVTTKTQGHVENYFKLLKFDDFGGKKRLRVDEFIKQQYNFLNSRLVGFAEEYRGTRKANPKKQGQRQKRKAGNGSESFEMAQEEWCKSTKTVQNKSGTYQNPPKQNLPPTPEKTVGAKEDSKKKNGFNLFTASINSRMQKKDKSNKNLLMKACAREWKQLSVEDREVWRDKAKALDMSRSNDKQQRSRGKREKRKRVTRTKIEKKNDRAEGEIPANYETASGRSLRGTSSSISSPAADMIPHPKYSGYEGLQNFGNSCWFNSILQCIAGLNLSQNIENDSYDLKANNVGLEAAETLRRMKTSSRPPDVHRDLYDQFLRTHKWGKGQQDAEEALVLLLNDLKESCTGKGSSACQRASSVLSTFKKCLDCNTECHTQDEAIHSFPLTIPDVDGTGGKELRLQNLYDQFFEAEYLTKKDCKVRCDCCGRETDHLKYSNITLPAEVLSLTLKRYSEQKTKKSERIRIDREIQVGNMLKDGKNERYHLRAIVMHVGEHLQTGHYKALLVEDEDNKLVEVDDEQVRELAPNYLSSKLVESSCYVLFYERDTVGEHSAMRSDAVGSNLSGIRASRHPLKEAAPSAREKRPTSAANLKRCMNIQGKDELFAQIDGIQIFGKDLKTLEYPQTDYSYSLTSPTGYVNDNVLSASLALIGKEARDVGLTVKVFDTNLAVQLQDIQNSKEMTPDEKGTALIKLTTRMKSFSKGPLVNYFILPQLLDGCHWTLTIVRDKTQRLREFVFYDPLSQKEVDPDFCNLLSLYIDYGQVFYSKPVIHDTYRKKSLMTEKAFPTQGDGCSCAVYCIAYAKVTTSLSTLCEKKMDATRARVQITKGLLDGEIDWSFLKLKPRDNLEIVVYPPSRIYLLSNDQLNLNCVATGGKGLLSYEWCALHGPLLSGRRDSQSYSQIVSGPGENLKLYCEVSDSTGNVEQTDIVDVTVLADFNALNSVHSGFKASLMLRAKNFWKMQNSTFSETDQQQEVNENEVREMVSSIKNYLLEIVCAVESSTNTHNQYRRHQIFLSKGKKALFNECTEIIGENYFGEETVCVIRDTVAEIFGKYIFQDSTELEIPDFSEHLDFHYLYIVLGTEAIVKLIMEKENCDYPTANKLALQH